MDVGMGPGMVRGTPAARSVTVIECPKAMVGRVIGKQGETIKALQNYTGALIQIDQTVEPTKVTISGTPNALTLATSMVMDIVKGTFKGFALLRQAAGPSSNSALHLRTSAAASFPPPMIIQPPPQPQPMQMQLQPRPVYAPGYGLIPPSQLYGAGVEPAQTAAFAPRRQSQPTVYTWPNGQVTPSQVILAGIQPSTNRGTTAMMNGALQQLSVQQVYGGMPMSGAYGTQLAYFPSDVSAATLQPTDGYMYQDHSAAAAGASSTAKLLQATNGARPRLMAKPPSAPAVEDLLGTTSSEATAQPPPSAAPNLVPVMDSETGKVFYYNASA